ncbi:hypothetical protein [Candidatus Pristimantibacillus sp. PTI5]|uniref:hypothetical protein n=1 Tax=Candidatus Pristimantibacillus sp. PTI5 TaxID=3400422 RepID=UPI003B0261D8
MEQIDDTTIPLTAKSKVLDVLHNVVNSFYNNESLQRKISLLSIHPSPSARKIEDDLLVIDDLIGSIERNISCGNMKRAFHFLLLLKKRVGETQIRIQTLDYYELLVTI